MVPGGIFAPLRALATTVGLAVAMVMEMAMASGGMPVPPSMSQAFAIAAMGGLFTASIRAPLVGVVLAVELTGAYALILPLLVTCITAHVIAEWLRGRPVYELLLERTLRLSGQTQPASHTTQPSSPVGIDEKPRSKVKRRRRRRG